MKLVHYDKARAALEKASQVDDVKSIRDQAEVLRQYARQIKNVEMEAWVAEIKVRAERRAGELLKGSQRWTPKFGQVAKVDSDLRMERSESCRNGKNTPLS